MSTPLGPCYIMGHGLECLTVDEEGGGVYILPLQEQSSQKVSEPWASPSLRAYKSLLKWILEQHPGDKVAIRNAKFPMYIATEGEIPFVNMMLTLGKQPILFTPEKLNENQYQFTIREKDSGQIICPDASLYKIHPPRSALRPRDSPYPMHWTLREEN
ncbi:hypothetical protein RhiLY_05252 [Ceratobasidium sp. AG-Ba]|nr:hypothetical protein RhiLY_05252 [Ceratobasidium sp. AG-Ba]